MLPSGGGALSVQCCSLMTSASMRRDSIGFTMLLFVECSASLGRESIGCTMLLFVDCSASMRRESIGLQCCCLLTVVLP